MRSFLEIKIGKWTNIVHHHLHVRYHVGFLGNQASLVAVLGQASESKVHFLRQSVLHYSEIPGKHQVCITMRCKGFVTCSVSKSKVGQSRIHWGDGEILWMGRSSGEGSRGVPLWWGEGGSFSGLIFQWREGCSRIGDLGKHGSLKGLLQRWRRLWTDNAFIRKDNWRGRIGLLKAGKEDRKSSLWIWRQRSLLNGVRLKGKVQDLGMKIREEEIIDPDIKNSFQFCIPFSSTWVSKSISYRYQRWLVEGVL